MNFSSEILLECKREAQEALEPTKDEEVIVALIEDIEEARSLLQKILKNAKHWGIQKHVEWIEEYFGEKK